MTTHLYLVRHGETDFNKNGIVQGRGVDTDLNATGVQQAERLAQRFADVQLDAIYSSPLRRAVQTASAVVQINPTLTLNTDPDLEEMSWGKFEGQDSSETLRTAFDEMRAQWKTGNLDFGAEGGETLRDVQTRGVASIHRILERHENQTILVVAHGRFLRVLLASLLSDYGIKRMEELSHSNTGVNYLIYQQNRFMSRYLNCRKHID